MNIFNKIIMVILLLLVAVICIVSIVNIFVDLYNIGDVADRVVNYFNTTNQFILALILFVILLVSLALLVLEFYRRKIKAASVTSDQSGKIMITVKSVANQVREELQGVDGIVDPKVDVVPKNDGIIINISSALVKGINVTDKTQQIRSIASNFASQDLGFKVLKTNYMATSFVGKKQEQVAEEKITPVTEEPPQQPQESEEDQQDQGDQEQ
ncbi:MAG: alkaline shock response membrane anchor protein AmaP [Actinomycetia bacterium]|nr:alkaline shock response membrane anchor protein AmaP [Actinomycetes bacterium]